MKIMQVIPSFNFGGAEIMCENLIYAQKKLGHDVCAVSLFNTHTPISDRIEAAGEKIFFLGKKSGFDPTVIGKLKKLFRAEKPDAIHVHLNAVRYVAFAARSAKIKKCVYTVHNIADKDASGILLKLNNYFFKHSMVFPVALNESVRDSITRVYGILGENIPVIFNGIDLSKCIVKKNYDLGKNIELLHIGRFSEAKNHNGLLHALAKIKTRYPDVTLRLLGSGQLREEIEDLARTLGISQNVVFEGTQSNVYPYLNAADLFVFPSVYEGMPMTLIEAMGTALPIVASNIKGISDILTDKVTASLCECDPDSIAEKCIELLDNRTLREKYGNAALYAAAPFSAQSMAERYVEVYAKKD